MRTIFSITAAIFVSILVAWPTNSLGQEIVNNLIISVKKDPGNSYNADDMNGGWYLGELGFVELLEVRTLGGSLTFADGDLSGVVLDFNSNRGPSEENPVSAPVPDGAAYNINSDGTVAMDIQDWNLSHPPNGYLSANRQYMVLRHPTVWGDLGSDYAVSLQMGLFIKQSTGLSKASLNGTYYFRDLETFNPGNPDRDAYNTWGTLTFDGSGNCSYNLYRYDSAGNTYGPETGNFGYSVNADNGIITLNDGGPEYYGQLSSDSAVLFFTMGRINNGSVYNRLSVAVKASNRTFSNADLIGEYYWACLEVDDMIIEEDRGAM